MRTLSTATDISRPWRMALSAEPLLRFHGQDPRFPDEFYRRIGEQAEHLAKALDESRDLGVIHPDGQVHIEGRPGHPQKRLATPPMTIYGTTAVSNAFAVARSASSICVIARVERIEGPRAGAGWPQLLSRC